MAITKPYDHIMKILARTYPEYFLKLIFPGIPVQLIGTLDNVELALEIDRVDFLHQININGDDACLHIDFEHRHKVAFPRRVFSYNGMLSELKKPIPIISVPIYLKRRKKEVPHSYDTVVGGYLFHRFTYEPILLWEHLDEIRSGKFYPLAPLLVFLTKNPTTDTLLEERDLILANEPDAKRRQTLFATAVLAALAQKIFEPDFVWSLFKEESMSLLDDPVIGKWLNEIYAPRLAEREAKREAEIKAEMEEMQALKHEALAAQREEEKKRRLAEKRRRLAEVKHREEEQKRRRTEEKLHLAEEKQRIEEERRREVEAALREAEMVLREEEAKRREEEAKRGKEEAEHREEEAKRREAEAKRREAEAKRREEEAKRLASEAKRRQTEWLSTTTKFLAHRFQNVPATLFLDLQGVPDTLHSQVINLLLDAPDIATFQQELKALL